MTSVILYRPSASGLQQANPITKLVLAGTLLAAAATIQPLAQLLAVFIVALVPLAAWSRVLALFLRTCARLIWIRRTFRPFGTGRWPGSREPVWTPGAN